MSSGKTLADFSISTEKISKYFQIAFSRYKGDKRVADLPIIFEVALSNLSLFPNLNRVASYEEYIERWVNNYYEAMTNLPSSKIATPKSSCSDPVIGTIVQNVLKCDSDDVDEMLSIHNLFMSAENIQGSLLEEYISSEVRKHGWCWCAGNVLRSVDFCLPEGPVLLQVKNKSNTENSSSSAIRLGTDIQKWYRLGTRKRNGVLVPDYKWEVLNEIINNNSLNPSEKCSMSEEKYKDFIKGIVKNNPALITGE